MRTHAPLDGQRFGQWLVLSLAVPGSATRTAKYLCRCDCGVERAVFSGNLKKGISTGCGHDKGERIRASKVKHGALANGEWHPLYNTWQSMISRCSNPRNVEFENYGAKGVCVHESWFDFRQFVADMGDKPTPQHSIDRFPDGAGNYEPGNVRWATKSEQNINRRTTRWLTFNGETLCAADWAKRLGLTKAGIYSRLRRGMTVEEALSLPPIPKGKYVRA